MPDSAPLGKVCRVVGRGMEMPGSVTPAPGHFLYGQERAVAGKGIAADTGMARSGGGSAAMGSSGLNREVAELQFRFGGNPGAADARVNFFESLRARR